MHVWENNLYAHAQNVTLCIRTHVRIICKVYRIHVGAMGDNPSSSSGDSLSSFDSENSESVPGPSSAVGC